MTRLPGIILITAVLAAAQQPVKVAAPATAGMPTYNVGSTGQNDPSKVTTPTPRKADEFVIHMSKKTGDETVLSSWRGKPVLLALLHATCPHCQELTQTVLRQVQTEYAPKGLQVVAAVFNDKDELRVQDFIRLTHANFPVGYSTGAEVMKFLHLPQSTQYYVPMLLFIDKTGIIRSAYLGDIPFLEHEDVNVRREIEKLLGNQPSAPAAKKSPAGSK